MIAWRPEKALIPCERERLISEDLLAQYAIERLPEAEAAAMEEHLLICVECQDRLQLTDDFIEVLRAVRRGEADDLLRG